MDFGELTSRYKNGFSVSFSNFKGTKEPEYDMLRETFMKIDEKSLVFDLVESKLKIEPLELIVKYIANKTVGDLIIQMMNKEGTVLGKIKFNKISFTKINGLIDFAFDRETKDKEITVSYECSDITYIGKSGKEEKLP